MGEEGGAWFTGPRLLPSRSPVYRGLRVRAQLDVPGGAVSQEVFARAHPEPRSPGVDTGFIRRKAAKPHGWMRGREAPDDQAPTLLC